MTATEAVGKSSATKEQTEFVMVVVVAAAAAGFASMVDADSGVVAAGIAFVEDGWGVEAASTMVAGFVVAAAEVVVRVGVACASKEVVELLVAAGFVIDGADEDCAAAVAGEFAVAVGPHRPCSCRLDCCTAAQKVGLVVVLVVSQASFAMAVSSWRCRSTVRSVEHAEAADGKLVIHAGAAHGSASVADAGSHVVAVAAEVAVAAVVALRGERFR